MQYSTVQSSIVQYSTVSAIQYSEMQYCTVQRRIVQYITVQVLGLMTGPEQAEALSKGELVVLVKGVAPPEYCSPPPPQTPIYIFPTSVPYFFFQEVQTRWIRRRST